MNNLCLLIRIVNCRCSAFRLQLTFWGKISGNFIRSCLWQATTLKAENYQKFGSQGPNFSHFEFSFSISKLKRLALISWKLIPDALKRAIFETNTWACEFFQTLKFNLQQYNHQEGSIRDNDLRISFDLKQGFFAWFFLWINILTTKHRIPV